MSLPQVPLQMKTTSTRECPFLRDLLSSATSGPSARTLPRTPAQGLINLNASSLTLARGWLGDLDGHFCTSYVFGWGQRFCPGYHIAKVSFFIILSRLIWALDLTAPIDPATGRAKVPDINDEEATYTSGFVSVPRIFSVSFKPRSHGREEQVRRTFQKAQSALDVQGLASERRPERRSRG